MFRFNIWFNCSSPWIHFIHFQPFFLNRTEKIFMESQPSDSAFVDHDSFSCVSCGRGSNSPPPHNSPSSLTPSQPDSASRLVSRWGWRLVSPARPSPFSFWIFEKYWQQFGEKLHKLWRPSSPLIPLNFFQIQSLAKLARRGQIRKGTNAIHPANKIHDEIKQSTIYNSWIWNWISAQSNFLQKLAST